MLPDGDNGPVNATIDIYSALAINPPSGKYTICSSIALTFPGNPASFKVIALATGSKCLPEVQLPLRGDLLHDSHAEILARRCAIRWFFEEIARTIRGHTSEWIERWSDGRFSLRNGVDVIMYISTVPCETLSSIFNVLFVISN